MHTYINNYTCVHIFDLSEIHIIYTSFYVNMITDMRILLQLIYFKYVCSSLFALSI